MSEQRPATILGGNYQIDTYSIKKRKNLVEENRLAMFN